MITSLGRIPAPGSAPAVPILCACSISTGRRKLCSPSTVGIYFSRKAHISDLSFFSGRPTRRRFERRARFSKSSTFETSSSIATFVVVFCDFSDYMSSSLVPILSSASVTRTDTAFNSFCIPWIALNRPSNLDTKSPFIVLMALRIWLELASVAEAPLLVFELVTPSQHVARGPGNFWAFAGCCFGGIWAGDSVLTQYVLVHWPL